jgi:hypothetical protein
MCACLLHHCVCLSACNKLSNAKNSFIKCYSGEFFGLLHQTLGIKTNMCICVQLEVHSLKFTRARKRIILTEVVEKNETHILCLIHFIHNLVGRLYLPTIIHLLMSYMLTCVSVETSTLFSVSSVLYMVNCMPVWQWMIWWEELH